MVSTQLIFGTVLLISIPALIIFFFYEQSYASPTSEILMLQSAQKRLVAGNLSEIRSNALLRNSSGKNLKFSPSGNATSGGKLPGDVPETETKITVTVQRSETGVTYRLVRDGTVTSYVFPVDHVKFTHDHKVYSSYEAALVARTLGQHLQHGRTIILAVVDLGYLDLAINLYMSSILKLRMYNYLFICSEKTACDILNALDIAAYSYLDYSKIGKTPSAYNTEQFRVKTHVKTMAILDALELRYSVLITDVDIVFLKNPFEHMTCDSCDIQITSDEVEGNSGFYLARNTAAARKLHKDALEMYRQNPKLSNQKTLDRTLERMGQDGKLKYAMLDKETFQNGYEYYEKGHRMWNTDYPCHTCVIVHNNWIVSNSAKIYRFKEHQHWFVDKNQYYSSKERKYITYANPANFGDNPQKEFDALRSAFWIAHVLNRTLVLPQFHKPRECKYEVCYGHYFSTFNTFYSVAALDKHLGEDSYRESSFLKNPMVPQHLSASQEEAIIIKNHIVKEAVGLTDPEPNHVFRPESLSDGATLDEIRWWFKQYDSNHVLHFRYLYDAVDLDRASQADSHFAQKLEDAIRSSDYRQYFEKPVLFEWQAAKTVSASFIFMIVVPVFVIPCLCLAVCYKTGACDMEEVEEYERRMKSIRRYRKAMRR